MNIFKKVTLNRMKKVKKKKLSLFKKLFVITTLLLISIFIITVFKPYFCPNISIKNGEEISLYIYDGDNFENVLAELTEMDVLLDIKSFKRLAKFDKYTENVKSGRYLLKNGMSNRKLLRMLGTGRQTPVKITFNNIRTKEQLAQRLSNQLMIDSAELIYLLNDPSVSETYGLNPETITCMFIPNTYEVYWNIKGKDLIEKMWTEYNKYWNKERKKKALKAGFTPIEISILASIVEEETNRKSEKPSVAGLYINRLRMGIPLQADPTVKFAIGDFSLKRILREQLRINSPYNTYLYMGLPPGPIRIPSIESLESVLNYKEHDYIYMCAKDDLSGSHNFAKTYAEHQENAVKYRRALNKKKIYK